MMMTFPEAVRSCLSKYVTFSGRAQRSEYWWWFLFTILVGMIGSTIDGALLPEGTELVAPLASLAIFLPSLAVGARRLHDRDMSGWILLAFIVGLIIPLINIAVLIGYIYLMATPGTTGPNKYGPDPKTGHDVGVFS